MEYEAASASPIGVVLTDLEDDHQVPRNDKYVCDRPVCWGAQWQVPSWAPSHRRNQPCYHSPYLPCYQIRFRGADGGILSGIALDEATSLEVHGPEGDGAAEVAVLHSIPRNAQGTFYQARMEATLWLNALLGVVKCFGCAAKP